MKEKGADLKEEAPINIRVKTLPKFVIRKC